MVSKPGPSQKKTEISEHSDQQDNSRKEEYGEDKELTSRTDVLPRQSMVCASTPDSVPTEKKLGIPMSSNYMLRTESSSTRSVTVPEIMNEDTLNIPSPDPGRSEKKIRFRKLLPIIKKEGKWRFPVYKEVQWLVCNGMKMPVAITI